MDDETIQPKVYQTSPGDRLIPLLLSLFLGCLAPLFAIASGPYFWPWGASAASSLLLAGAAAFYRWRRAVGAVVFDRPNATLSLLQGRVLLRVECTQLTRVETRPASVRTSLWVGKKRYRLSHRLVGVDDLLSNLRLQRPDLFVEDARRHRFRRSTASAWLQLVLAGGTGLAGILMGEWQPWLGWLFGLSSGYVVLRIAFFIPLRYEVEPGLLTVRYLLRRRRWKKAVTVVGDSYAAGGAEFYRLTLDYGRWKVVLDEGQLIDAVRPTASRVTELLLSSNPV